MDGEARNRHERPPEIDKAHLGMKGVLPAQHDLAREAERPVQPRAQNQPAIRLNIQQAIALAHEPRRWFQPEAWKIRMRRRHAQRPRRADRERQQRRAIDADEITPATRKLPGAAKFQFLEPRPAELFRRGCHRMARRRRGRDEIQKFLCLVCHESFPSFSACSCLGASRLFVSSKSATRTCMRSKSV